MKVHEDSNGYVRGIAGCIMTWCPKCDYYSYGSYCINCGHVTRYATLEDVAGLDDVELDTTRQSG